MTLDVGSFGGVSVVELGSEGDETLLLSVPSSWILRGTKGVRIEDLKSEPPSLGFTRWHLPPKASITFNVPYEVPGMIVHNPSAVALKIAVTRVTLPEERVERDVVLIQKESSRIW